MLELCIPVKKEAEHMEFRLANTADLDGVTAVYEAIHDSEEACRTVIGWERGVYPTRATAEAALARGDFADAIRCAPRTDSSPSSATFRGL